jgi:UDP-N-acetylglucosamine 2-epimerase (non-hydrolysing)/GDP/UDP-N,N'-diacetylbacillosamine 2-epimerase (hydrolysing)
VTLLADTNAEADVLFSVLEQMEEQLIFCYPNADAGSRELAARVKDLVAKRADSKVFINLPTVEYWSLMRNVSLFVGNSSSGIMETASFAIPTVNVGMRQQGRERARNVLDAEPSRESIVAAIAQARSGEFRRSLEGMQNPYGDGCAAERIVQVLAALASRDALLFKRAAAGES